MQLLVDLFGFLSVVLRAGTLICQSLLLGGTLFLLWTARPSRELSGEAIERVQSSSRVLLRWAAFGLVLAQLLVLYVNSSVLMVTAEIGFRDVIGANFFVAGLVVLVTALGIGALPVGRGRLATFWLLMFVVAILAASVMTSHAVARMSGRAWLILLTSLHQAATGFWIGGIPFLMLSIFRARDRLTQWYLIERFSRASLVSVAVLLITGTALSMSYVGSLRAIVGTAYGVMVSAKVLMLGGLLILGGVNFLLIRNRGPEYSIPRIRRIVEAEIGIGITVILTAASLTSQPPAVDIAQDTVNLQQIAHRLKPKWPGFALPSYAGSSGDIQASQKNLAVKVAESPVAFNVDGQPLKRGNLADIRESEANHHWMGLVVLAMGVMALLARTGKIPWAEYWPLLLISITVFIFVGADSESWPLGPQGFWACWLKPEVFQHRVAGLVCVGFAVFELRVRKYHRGANYGALVFPLMCAVGGALLLTHSHSITNIKEALLVELSHVPLGLLAVCAGWTRWLELRMADYKWKSPSWIWPICFVLIGVGLLNYREL